MVTHTSSTLTVTLAGQRLKRYRVSHSTQVNNKNGLQDGSEPLEDHKKFQLTEDPHSIHKTSQTLQENGVSNIENHQHIMPRAMEELK